MRKSLVDPGWSWDDAFCYSQGMQLGNLLFVSGQAAIDADGSVVGVGDFEAQARQVFRNLRTVLKKAGAGLEDIVKVTIFVTDMTHFPVIVKLREEFFSEPYPTDSIVQVQALALPDLMVEIEAIAVPAASP